MSAVNWVPGPLYSTVLFHLVARIVNELSYETLVCTSSNSFKLRT